MEPAKKKQKIFHENSELTQHQQSLIIGVRKGPITKVLTLQNKSATIISEKFGDVVYKMPRLTITKNAVPFGKIKKIQTVGYGLFPGLMMLTFDGLVYSMGTNVVNSLALNQKTAKVPRLVEFTKTYPVRDIGKTANGALSFFYLKNGDVCVSGSVNQSCIKWVTEEAESIKYELTHELKMQMPVFSRQRVKQISIHNDGLILLTDGSVLIVTGNPAPEGQQVKPVIFPTKVTIVKVQATKDCWYCLTDSGQLYFWGQSLVYFLGAPVALKQYFPVLFTGPFQMYTSVSPQLTDRPQVFADFHVTDFQYGNQVQLMSKDGQLWLLKHDFTTQSLTVFNKVDGICSTEAELGFTTDNYSKLQIWTKNQRLEEIDIKEYFGVDPDDYYLSQVTATEAFSPKDVFYLFYYRKTLKEHDWRLKLLSMTKQSQLADIIVK